MPDFKHDDERRTGLYATLAFHLGVLIILLLISIGSVVDKEHSFVLDFTKQEEREKEIKQMEMKEEAKRQIDELLGRPAPRVRNVAVDAGERLRDNKGRTFSASWTPPSAMRCAKSPSPRRWIWAREPRRPRGRTLQHTVVLRSSHIPWTAARRATFRFRPTRATAAVTFMSPSG